MSNQIANQSQLTLGTSCIELTREPVASHSTELIQKIQITGVYPATFQEKPAGTEAAQAWKYRFNTMTIVNVFMSDGSKLSIELQELTNQATWSGGTLADQQQAIDDINTWLSI